MASRRSFNVEKNDKKCIFVEIVDENANCPYELFIENSTFSDTKDLELVMAAMVYKNDSLESIFTSRCYHFLIESVHKPGKFVLFDYEKPLKDHSELRLVIHKVSSYVKASSPNSQIALSTLPESNHLIDVTTKRGSVHPTNSGSHENPHASSTSFQITLSADQQSSLSSAHVRTEASSLRSSKMVLHEGGCPSSSLALCTDSQLANFTSSISDATDEDISEEEHLLNELWPVSERKRFQHQPLNMTKFKLPNCYGFAVDNKLKNISASLDNNDYNSICRILAKSIEEFTIHPDPKSIRFVVDQLIAKYPTIIIDKENKASTLSMLYLKMKRIFEGKRRLANQQFSTKGGRPRVTAVDEGPAAKRTPNAIEFDSQSYDQNVGKLKNLVANNGNKDNIITLFNITHLGRRREIKEGSYSDIYDFMKNHCPVLNDICFLHGEFEFLLGKGACRKFRDRWTECVPLILRVAKKRNSNGNIKKLFDQFKTSDIKDSFETKACAALQFLVALLPMRNKKGVNAIEYIYYAKEESASLNSTLKATKGRQSFIIHLEDEFHVIVDSKPFVTSSTLTEALLNLFCSLYVCNISYNKEVLNSFLFLQRVVVGKTDTLTHSPTINMFVKEIEKEREQTSKK